MRDIEYILTDLDIRLCIQLLFDFLEQFPAPLLSVKSIETIFLFMTKESPDMVTVFQNENVNKIIEKHEFYLMNAFISFSTSSLNKSEMTEMKSFFLRISLSLLKKKSEISEMFNNDSLMFGQLQKDFLSKDETIKKTRQIFWLWHEEVRTGGEFQIHEIEEAYKSVSSPLLIKKKTVFEEKRKRANTEGIKTKFFTLRNAAGGGDSSGEEKKSEKI